MNTYDYPAGADNSNAPWNEVNKPEIEVKVKIRLEMELENAIVTSEYELDEEGYPIIGDVTADTYEQVAFPNDYPELKNWEITNCIIEEE